MDTKTLKRGGIGFAFNRDDHAPQIPYVQDILYVLHLAEEDAEYRFCLRYSPRYISNVALVMAAVSDEVLGDPRRTDAEIRGVIARAIVDLCPDEAKCLLCAAYVEAGTLIGKVRVDPAANPVMRMALCPCPQCGAMRKEQVSQSCGA